MRASLTPVAVVFVTPFVVGCSQMGQSTSPTFPTSALSITSPSGTFSGTGTVTALSASASTDVVTIPVRFTISPAAKTAIQACIGEALTFDGTALLVAHQTILPNGSTLLDAIHFNGQGAVALGASTGATYRLAGADSNQVILAPSGTVTATFEANLLAIGPGSAKSFLGHVLQHVTVTPDGNITALVDVVSIDCR